MKEKTIIRLVATLYAFGFVIALISDAIKDPGSVIVMVLFFAACIVGLVISERRHNN